MTSAAASQARPRARLRELLSQPVDIAWLAAFRVLFGTVMAISMLRFLAYGWIDDFFVTPKFHFKYWLFDWIEPLPAGLMHGLFWLMLALALCIALGLWFRLAAAAFALGFAYLSLLDVAIYLNHYYLALLLAVLLCLSPAGQAYALDARQGPTVRTVPRLWLVLVRFQVGTVYTFAGLAKATGDWLVHAQPLNIWLSARTDLPLLGPLFAQPWAAPLMSWAGFLFDTTIVWWLLWPRARPYAYAAVIGFHVLTRLLFPIGMFPVIMVLGALVFFPPDWPRTLWARLRRTFSAQASAPVAAPRMEGGPTRLVSRFAVYALGLYCALQLLVPLRFLAYGGDVLWHEQGMRFSWRVMVREKNGSVSFHVRSKATGRVWEVSPGRWLTRQQEREMAGQPDLILQFAHFLRDDFAARGLGPVEVRAEARVSLNGRPGAVLVDPEVDLARVDDGVAKAHWIRAAPQVPPPSVRPI
ncbi:MAG TPA: HTTM domain-containing protein [Polyangiaceae bacterium]|nr:HTTM domain-containing protein [Polyangiaceae bacterium]